MKIILSLPLLILLYFNSYSQHKSYFEVSMNRGIGLDWQSINYTSLNSRDTHKLPYSTGGGTGVELGFGKYVSNRLSLSASIGYRQILTFKYENSNGMSNKSSASFNYKMLEAGINYAICKSEKIIEEVSLGGMAIYSDAGKLRIIEDRKRIALDKFDNSYGWKVQTNFILDVFSKNNLKGKAALSYKSLSYKISDASESPAYTELNGNGIDLIVGITKFF